MKPIRVYYAPEDDGAGAPPETPAPGADAVAQAGAAAVPPEDPPPEDKPKVPPKFSSQLSPEAREKHKDALDAMGEETSLTDAFTELMDSRGKLSRSILMPEKDNPEDLKRFMKDMGIPESPEGYGIDEKILGPDATKLLTTQALKAGMTMKQAQAMHGFVGAIMKNGQAGIAEATAKRSETFDSRMAEASGSEEAGANATKYATKFLIRFGDKDTINSLERTGMIYNTTFMSKLAEFEKALGDTKYVGGETNQKPAADGAKQGAFGTYSEEWNEQYGGK